MTDETLNPGVERSVRPIGTDSSDPLLSLEDDAQHVRRAVLTMARHLWTTTLMSTKAPLGRDQFERMKAPRPGDYVAEHSAARRAANGQDPERWYHGFGVLIEAIGDEVFFVQYGPAAGDVCRWENATMYALPLAADGWPR